MRIGHCDDRNICDNIVLTFVYTSSGDPEAGVLYSTFGLLLSPIIAAAPMSSGSDRQCSLGCTNLKVRSARNESEKRYGVPQTPCQRLLDVESTPAAGKTRLGELAIGLDPLKLLTDFVNKGLQRNGG